MPGSLAHRNPASAVVPPPAVHAAHRIHTQQPHRPVHQPALRLPERPARAQRTCPPGAKQTRHLKRPVFLRYIRHATHLRTQTSEQQKSAQAHPSTIRLPACLVDERRSPPAHFLFLSRPATLMWNSTRTAQTVHRPAVHQAFHGKTSCITHNDSLAGRPAPVESCEQAHRRPAAPSAADTTRKPSGQSQASDSSP